MPFGLPPTLIVAAILPVAGSIRETVPSPEFAIQIEPFPYATPSGATPTLVVPLGWFTTDRSPTLVAPDVGHPDCSPTERDPVQPEHLDEDLRDDRVTARIDTRHHRVLVRPCDPDGALADRDPAEAWEGVDVMDARHHPTGLEVDPR